MHQQSEPKVLVLSLAN